MSKLKESLEAFWEARVMLPLHEASMLRTTAAAEDDGGAPAPQNGICECDDS